MPSNNTGGKVLITFALIGGIVSFWFWDASHLASKGGSAVNTSYRSYLPAVCNVLVDRAGAPRKSAKYYAWGASAHIDLQVTDLDNKKTMTHAIITPAGTTYLWQDGISEGVIKRGTKDYAIIQNVAPNNSWFCFPWLFYDNSKFSLPRGIKFL